MRSFQYSEAIVHSVDDASYPNVDDSGLGISGWFKLEIWDFYHNGLEFIVWLDGGIRDKEGNWAVIEYGQIFDATQYEQIKMFRLARIPFRNIIDVDTVGDEYYPQPHIYCRFRDGGAPYEGFRRVIIDDGYPWPMDPERQFELKPGKQSPLTRRAAQDKQNTDARGKTE